MWQLSSPKTYVPLTEDRTPNKWGNRMLKGRDIVSETQIQACAKQVTVASTSKSSLVKGRENCRPNSNSHMCRTGNSGRYLENHPSWREEGRGTEPGLKTWALETGKRYQVKGVQILSRRQDMIATTTGSPKTSSSHLTERKVGQKNRTIVGSRMCNNNMVLLSFKRFFLGRRFLVINEKQTGRFQVWWASSAISRLPREENTAYFSLGFTVRD